MLAAHQRFDCRLLRRGRPFVDDQLQSAVALVDRAGKRDQLREPHPVEAGVAEPALADLPRDQCQALAMRRIGLELARTAPIAIAAADLITSDPPLGRCTSSPPFLTSVRPPEPP